MFTCVNATRDTTVILETVKNQTHMSDKKLIKVLFITDDPARARQIRKQLADLASELRRQLV